MLSDHDRGGGRRSGAPRRISALVGLLSILGLMWAAAQGLFTLIVLQSDETGGTCDVPEPALAGIGAVTLALAVASVGFALVPRNARSLLALAAAVGLFAVWIALGGMSALGCIIE